MAAQNNNTNVMASHDTIALKAPKRLVPQLRFKEFDGEWNEKTLKEVTKINQGLQIAIADRYLEPIENAHFYITNEFLKEGSTKKYYILNPPESVLCEEKDILMTRTGNTGQVVTGVKGAFHNNFFKIKFDSHVDKDFLFFFLNSHRTQHTILKLAGTSTIPDLNHGDFYRIKINLPSLPEQQKIAQFLTAVDSKLQQLNQKKELLEQYKKGVMQQLFSQQLRFKQDNGSDYPNWEEKKLGDVSYITTGSSNRVDSSLDGEYTFFDRSEDIRTSSIYLFDDEAVIVPGEGQDFIPKYFIGKFDLHQRTYAIMKFENCLGKFIYYHLVQHPNYLLSQSVGSTVKSLRLPMFKKMKINFPSTEEQQKIASYLSAIDTKIATVTQQIEATQQFKKGLLQQMFV
ncbi:restriction endonuclease subunit S [Tamlana sp. 62-3]|uniref:Restriction endonuclease subunit S n=1 Tax=Neotamlana sargassicola TaxID=2883125 RepID=A0A9X1I665_9FLAO|nr:restriction endonuclease subunit S [Tamlana sargassicola]MCB4808575.1 restriction endonuclease subunit S [Tamlana sargassicola]